MSIWMIYALVITGIAYVAAVIGEHLLWIWRAPRRIAWLSAVIVGVAGPVVLPLWYGASSQPAVAAPSVITPEPPRLTILPSRAASSMRRSAVVETPRPAVTFGASHARFLESALPTLWVGASGLLLCWAMTSYARLQRQSATWREMSVDGTRVVVSPNCGPAVFGIWRPRIVIPTWALSLDAEARALMLRHEREHLRARDAQCLLMSIVAALLFPWNAALWMLVRRLRLAIELDCDDRVLRGHTDTRAYGSLLLAVSARRNREMPLAVALVERASMLERRIRAMTAITPRRRLLISIPLLLGVVLLSAAAARTPSPRPFSLRHRSALVLEARAVTNAFPFNAPPDSAKPRAIRVSLPGLGIRRLPRLATPESIPVISATWENAPIENVIAAFATFSHRRITMARSVTGFVTADVVDQPWTQALERIMAGQGLGVEFRADSSMYIAPLKNADAPPRESEQTVQISRGVSGTVTDAVTGAPIRDARINVAGLQLIGAPNEARSDEHGRFALRVSDGEVWLDACAPGYDFRRVTLAPEDTVAEFRGDKTREDVSSDTVRIDRKDIRDIELIKGRGAEALNGNATANGLIEVTTKVGTTRRISAGPEASGPVLIIDGAVVSTSGAQTRGCGLQPTIMRAGFWFRLLNVDPARDKRPQ